MTVYRYSWGGVDLKDLASSLDPARVISKQGPAPAPVLDITIDSASETDKTDLDAAMLSLGWCYSSTDPLAQPKGISLRQEVGARVLVDSTTNSDVFVDLLTVPITTNACVMGLIMSAVSEATAQLGYFRITVDGVVVAGGAHMIGTASLFLGVRVPCPAGAHTVKLQWRTDVSGTHTVRPVTLPEVEFANLLVREMSG